MSAAVAAASERVLTLLKEPIVPTVGVHPSVSFETYHAWEAASNSRLSVLRRSPAHLKAYIENGSDAKALAMGRATHSAILEPDDFVKRYLKADRCEAITAKKERCRNQGIAYRGAEGWTCGVHGSGVSDSGVTILPAPDYDVTCRMRDAVLAHDKASKLLARGERELSVAWTDTDNDLLCKARIDHHTPVIAGGAIVDIKTTRDASPRAFERAIYDYGYHSQGAFYLSGAQAHGLPVEHFVIVAVEKEPPFAVGVYRLTEGALDAGVEQLKPLMATYAHCLRTDQWPGYSSDVIDIAIPSYAWDQISAEASE